MSWSLDKKPVRLKIKAFICDAPAIAFIKGIKGHTGYCERCTIRGEYKFNIIVHLGNSCLRTDKNHFQVECILIIKLGVSPLQTSDVKCVTEFV
jgi:hypothetical protein